MAKSEAAYRYGKTERIWPVIMVGSALFIVTFMTACLVYFIMKGEISGKALFVLVFLPVFLGFALYMMLKQSRNAFSEYTVTAVGLQVKRFNKTVCLAWHEIADFEMLPNNNFNGLVLYPVAGKPIRITPSLVDYPLFLKEIAKYYEPVAEYVNGRMRVIPEKELIRRKRFGRFETWKSIVMIPVLLIILLLSVFGVYFSFDEMLTQNHILEHGVTTTALVLKVVNDDDDTFLKIEYCDDKGKTHKGSYDVSETFASKHPEKSTVQVWYDPHDPRDMMIKEQYNPRRKWAALIIFTPISLALFCALSNVINNLAAGRRRVIGLMTMKQDGKYKIMFNNLPPTLALNSQAWPDKHWRLPLVVLDYSGNDPHNSLASYASELNNMDIMNEAIEDAAVILDPENAEKLYLSEDYGDSRLHTYAVLPGAALENPKKWFLLNIETPGKLNCFSPEIEFYCCPNEVGPFAQSQINEALDRLIVTYLRFFCYLSPPQEFTARSIRELLCINEYPEAFMLTFITTGKGVSLYYRAGNDKQVTLLTNKNGFLECKMGHSLPRFMWKQHWYTSIGFYLLAPLFLLILPLTLIAWPITWCEKFFKKRALKKAREEEAGQTGK